MSVADATAKLKEIKGKVAKTLKQVDESLKKTSLGQYYQATCEDKVPLSMAIVGIVVLLLVVIVLMWGEAAFCNLIGYAYPFYKSYQALQAPQSTISYQWLTYWMMFAGFSVVESLFSFITHLIPMYFWLKVGLLIWLGYFEGATKVYEQVLVRFLEPKIQQFKTLISDDVSSTELNLQANEK